MMIRDIVKGGVSFWATHWILWTKTSERWFRTKPNKKLDIHENEHVDRKWSWAKIEHPLQEKHVQIIQYHTGDLSINEMTFFPEKIFPRFTFLFSNIWTRWDFSSHIQYYSSNSNWMVSIIWIRRHLNWARLKYAQLYNFSPQVKEIRKKEVSKKGPEREKLTLQIESDALIFSKQRQSNFQQFDTHVDLDSMWSTPSTLHATPNVEKRRIDWNSSLFQCLSLYHINCMCRMGHTTHLLFQKPFETWLLNDWDSIYCSLRWDKNEIFYSKGIRSWLRLPVCWALFTLKHDEA